MANLYDLKAWADQTTRGRQVFNLGYRLPARGLRGWTRLKALAVPGSERASETVYLLRQNELGDRALSRVSVTVLSSWRDAQKRLRETLAHCMRPAIPPGTGRLASIGDVNVIARDPQSDVAAAVMFARGNVCVSVASVGQVSIDVAGVAAGIDRALAGPLPAAKARGPAVKAPRAVVVRARQRVALIRSLKTSVPANTWLKVIVPDGEIARRGESLVYVSPEAGKKQIGVHTSRTG